MPPSTSVLHGNITHIPLYREFRYLDLFYTNLVLPFTMEAQTQTNWCWAATSKSVSHFYTTLSPWTQCKIAGNELDKTCCTSPVPSACNVPWYLDKALSRTQNFVSIQAGTISWSEIKDQLDNGLLVGARIGWNGGGGHFMVIHGVSRIGATQYVHIDDPIYAKNTMTYDTFATNYLGSGTWTHTYFTKRHFYFMWLKDLQFNPRLLRPIPEVRPLARLANNSLNLTEPLGEPDLSTAHYTYMVGLNEINSDFRLPERPASLRVLEFEDSSPIAIYEVGLNEEEPELINLNAGKPYFKNFEAALNRLKRNSISDTSAELRHVRVPGLNIEAAWLHYEDESQDKFILITNFEDQKNKVYQLHDFRELLMTQKAAMGEMNELMGS